MRTKIMIFAVIFFAVLIQSQELSDRDIQQIEYDAGTAYNDGVQLYQTQDYTGAIEKFLFALEKYKSIDFEYNPKTDKINELYKNLSVLYNTTKEYGKAIEYYKLRIESDPDNYKIVYSLSSIYKKMGDKTKSLNTLIQYDEKYSNYKIKKKIAEAFEEKNDLQNAIKYYSEAFEINNKKVDILEKIALMYHNIGQDTSAIKIYNNYIATQPKDYILRKVYKNLGIFYQGLGDEENAIIAFENSYHIKNDEEIGLILAQIYYERGDYSKAKNKLAEVQKNDQNNPQAHYYLGLIYRKDGKINKALAEFEKIKNHPQLGASAKKQIEYIKSTYTIKRTDDLQVHYDSGKKGLQEKKTETYTKKRSDELQVLYDSGLLKKFKIDYNEAWVNPFLWNSLDYDTKVGIGITLAKICDKAGSTGRITFYDNKTGKKLAKYSQPWGYKSY